MDPGVIPSSNAYCGVSQKGSRVTCLLHFPVQYCIYSCVLGLISCSVFLRVNYELKMLIMMVALVGYNTILLHTHAHVLDDYSQVLFER